MTASLDDLVQDYFRNPRREEEGDRQDFCAEGHNPLCGDKVQVYRTGTGLNPDFTFRAIGCSLSKAAASVACDVFWGRSADEVERLSKALLAELSEEKPGSQLTDHRLEVLAEMRDYPVRRKCVQLPFDTILKCLSNQPQMEKSEGE